MDEQELWDLLYGNQSDMLMSFDDKYPNLAGQPAAQAAPTRISAGFQLPDTASLFQSKIDEAADQMGDISASRAQHYSELDSLSDYTEKSYKPAMTILMSALGGYLGGGPVDKWAPTAIDFARSTTGLVQDEQKAKQNALLKEIAFDETSINDWRNMQQQMQAGQASTQARMLEALAEGQFVGSPQAEQKRQENLTDSVSQQLQVQEALGNRPGTAQWKLKQDALIEQEKARGEAMMSIEAETRKRIEEAKRSVPVTNPNLNKLGFKNLGDLDDWSQYEKSNAREQTMGMKQLDAVRKNLNDLKSESAFESQGVMKTVPKLTPKEMKDTSELLAETNDLQMTLNKAFDEVIKNGASMVGSQKAVTDWIAGAGINKMRNYTKSGANYTPEEIGFNKAWMPRILSILDRMESIATGTFNPETWVRMKQEVNQYLTESKAVRLLGYRQYLTGFPYDRNSPTIKALEASGQMAFNTKGVATYNSNYIESRKRQDELEKTIETMFSDLSSSIEGRADRLSDDPDARRLQELGYTFQPKSGGGLQ